MKKHIWHPVEGYPELFVGQYLVPGFMSNSVAVQVGEKTWLVMSPGAGLLDDWSRICPDPDVEITLICPNSFHYMGVSDWLARFPEARVFASAKASTRLRKKGLAQVQVISDSAPRLPSDYFWRIPPGHRGGDIWLCKRPSSRSRQGGVWIICDSFLNYQRKSNRWLARTVQTLADAAPGLKLSRVIKWVLLDNRRAFRPWVLKELASESPSLLIPMHGEPLESPDIGVQLARIVKETL